MERSESLDKGTSARPTGCGPPFYQLALGPVGSVRFALVKTRSERTKLAARGTSPRAAGGFPRVSRGWSTSRRSPCFVRARWTKGLSCAGDGVRSLGNGGNWILVAGGDGRRGRSLRRWDEEPLAVGTCSRLLELPAARGACPRTVICTGASLADWVANFSSYFWPLADCLADGNLCRWG